MSNAVTVSQDYLDELKAGMIRDYSNWQDSYGTRERTAIQDQMLVDYSNSFRFDFGKKYIKVVAQNSVRGFIVNTDKDAKFAFGDMLMAAGFNAPARNFSRGNIFEETSRKNVAWTGIA